MTLYTAQKIGVHTDALVALDDIGEQIAKPELHVLLRQEHMREPVHLVCHLPQVLDPAARLR